MAETIQDGFTSDGREKRAIIGGGVGGAFAALFSARMKDDKGRPKNHVTLFETQPLLFNGASLLGSRFHATGGEYPLDIPSAEGCLYGALTSLLLLPPGIFTTRKATKFVIAQATEEEGRLTVEKALATNEHIRKKYESLCIILKGINVAITPEVLLGSPERENFGRKLKKHELAQYDGEVRGAFAKKIAAEIGYQSRELGYNTPLYLALLQDALLNEQKKGTLEIRTNCGVNNIVRRLKDGLFELHLPNGEAFVCNQLIESAWDKGAMLTPPPQGQQVIAYNRQMLILDTGGQNIDPIFVMLGKHGGMLSPWGSNKAIAYLPTLQNAYKSEKIITQQDPFPEEEQAHDEYTDFQDMRSYHRGLVRLFPVLAKSSTPLEVVTRKTLNFQNELHQRQQPEPYEYAPGWFSIRSVKSTTAAWTGLKVALMAEQRRKEGKESLRPIRIPKALYEAASGKYSLKDVAEINPLNAERFAKTHPPLPAGLAIEKPSDIITIGGVERRLDEFKKRPIPPGGDKGSDSGPAR